MKDTEQDLVDQLITGYHAQTVDGIVKYAMKARSEDAYRDRDAAESEIVELIDAALKNRRYLAAVTLTASPNKNQCVRAFEDLVSEGPVDNFVNITNEDLPTIADMAYYCLRKDIRNALDLLGWRLFLEAYPEETEKRGN